MLLYHGSKEIVSTPVYGLGSDKNDYGRGFYCTEEIELAKEWATPIARDGFVNKYELDESNLKILNLDEDGYHILNWMALLLNNRIFTKRSLISKQGNAYILKEFLPDISQYDVICGYRADDSYFSYAKDFLNNTISVGQLAHAMKLGELGKQVVLVSPKAFSQIRFLGYEIAESSIYYPRRMERENMARRAYLNSHGSEFALSKQDMYIREIIMEEVKNDDPRLR